MTLLLLSGLTCAVIAFLLRVTRRAPSEAATAPSVEPDAPPKGITPLTPRTVRVSPPTVPSFLEPHPEHRGGAYLYWDGSAEADAAADALRRLPPRLRTLFDEAVSSAALTVRLSDETDIRLLAPEHFDLTQPRQDCSPIGLYLPGRCLLVAVDCDEDPARAERTALHEAMHLLDDHLGTPAGVPGDYHSHEEAFDQLVSDLPRAVIESFLSWGYLDDEIPIEIFAEGGAAYLRHHANDRQARAQAIGQALTRYARDPAPDAVLEAGRRMDMYFTQLESRLSTPAC